MIATEFLIRKNQSGQMKVPFTKIGRYVFDNTKLHKNGEFDIVTLDENGWIDYECKYTKEPVGKKIVEAESQHAKEMNLDFYQFGFFSKNGFKDDFDHTGYLLFSLEDLF